MKCGRLRLLIFSLLMQQSSKNQAQPSKSSNYHTSLRYMSVAQVLPGSLLSSSFFAVVYTACVNMSRHGRPCATASILCKHGLVLRAVFGLQTLFYKGRYRQEPYEWVYEGLKPLDMMDVLQTGKGISLTLSVIFLGIARQLNIPMSMVPIPEGICFPHQYSRRPKSIKHTAACSSALASCHQVAVILL